MCRCDFSEAKGSFADATPPRYGIKTYQGGTMLFCHGGMQGKICVGHSNA